VEAAVGGQAQVEVRISQMAGGRARGTRVGRCSTCDSVSVQTDVRWTERAVLVVVVRQCRGQVLAACSREVADLSTTLLTIDRWIASST